MDTMNAVKAKNTNMLDTVMTLFVDYVGSSGATVVLQLSSPSLRLARRTLRELAQRQIAIHTQRPYGWVREHYLLDGANREGDEIHMRFSLNQGTVA